MVDRLCNLIAIFENPALDFSSNRADGDDLLGDAYEYLMRNFATESGKSKGQFYTPAEVSRVMAKVIGVGQATNQKQTIYDPTCGSGSLLLKAHNEAMSAKKLDLALYGQEMDNATRALAKMNTILHGCPSAEIHQDNTLSTPYFKASEKSNALRTFDFVVANPPFSTKAWSTGFDPNADEYKRFEYGIPPEKNGDYAFLLHILASLNSKGKGAVILPHGVLFRGNTEAGIRKNLLMQGFIKGIIGLPANLFFGTSIPACIIVLDKENHSARKGVFMIDASKGFIKDGNKNRLRAQDIHKIVDTFTRLAEVPRYSRMVSLDEIQDPKNDCNLNLPRYIDSSEPEDIQDIAAHLRGGIPNRDIDALKPYWDVFGGVRNALFQKSTYPGYSELRVPTEDIKKTIFEHPEYSKWSETVTKRFTRWRDECAKWLRGIEKGEAPKKRIEAISEKLLEAFEGAPLLDKYDIYQHLMEYWEQTMQDDVYLIAAAGWIEAAKPVAMSDEKKKNKDKPDFVLGKKKYKTELIPTDLIVDRYFASEKAAIDALEAKAETLAQEIEEFEEQHSAEEGLLTEAINDNGKVVKALVSARLQAIKKDKRAEDERKVLVKWAEMTESEADARAKAKQLSEALTEKMASKYGALTESEIKELVVDRKWLGAVGQKLHGELADISLRIATQSRRLATRYSEPVTALMRTLSTNSEKVDNHLMKFSTSIEGHSFG